VTLLGLAVAAGLVQWFVDRSIALQQAPARRLALTQARRLLSHIDAIVLGIAAVHARASDRRNPLCLKDEFDRLGQLLREVNWQAPANVLPPRPLGVFISERSQEVTADYRSTSDNIAAYAPRSVSDAVFDVFEDQGHTVLTFCSFVGQFTMTYSAPAYDAIRFSECVEGLRRALPERK
jgi:hypothetical protein